VTEACKNYLRPLIQGEAYPPYKDGVIETASLKNKVVKKKLKTFKV
jgi:6-phosphofructokinase 1